MSNLEFTREELASELLAMQDEITAGQADPELVSLFAFAADQFDIAVTTEVSEGVIDEAQAIDFEDFRSGLVTAVHQAAKDQMGNTPHVNLLGHRKETPRADAKRLAEQIALDAEREVNANRILEEITAVETKHAVSSGVLRQSHYIDPTAKPPRQNGTWLARKLEEVVNNGSNMAMFTSDEAKVLAGNSLTKRTYADVAELKQDLEQLAKLHEQAKFFGARVKPGLFSGVSKLQELAETAAFDNRSDLQEVRRFVELLEAPAEDLFERVASALDEGPFADCPELDVTPFPPNTEQGGRSSLKEIPSDKVTEDNILDDIKNAIEASGATEYIIEEERISEFVGLKEHLERKYQGQVKIYRSLRSNWHPLPWYVVEIAQPNDPSMVVLESPIYGNASYYINNGEWQDTLGFRRKEAQQLGAKPIVHSLGEGQTLAVHTDRIKAVIEAGYKD